MAYQSKYKGKEVEDILDNALLKKKQTLTDEEKKLVKENLDIKDVDITGKQDTIEDLDEIRSGASKGATALQSVPDEYVTMDELDSKLEELEASKEDLVAIELSEEGEMILSYGKDTNLSDGYISESGELVLEFNYE